MDKKPEISNVEWGLVIGALATADLTMFLLDLTGIGEFVDPFIDGFIAMAYPLYLHLRGQDMTQGKRLAGVIGTFLLGLFTDGTLDFWWADGLYNMYLYKAEKKIEQLEAKIPGGQMVGKVIQRKVGSPNSQTGQSGSSTPKRNPDLALGHPNTTYTPK